MTRQGLPAPFHARAETVTAIPCRLRILALYCAAVGGMLFRRLDAQSQKTIP
jgi:hypothetical protein